MKSKTIEKLKFQKREVLLAARFTVKEAETIRQFCAKNEIKLSDVVRTAFKTLIPNL